MAYIQIAEEKDRALGNALREEIGPIVSAPGVELRKSEPENSVRYFSPEDAALESERGRRKEIKGGGTPYRT